MDPSALKRLVVRVAVSRVVGRLTLLALAALLGWFGMSGHARAYGLVAKIAQTSVVWGSGACTGKASATAVLQCLADATAADRATFAATTNRTVVTRTAPICTAVSATSESCIFQYYGYNSSDTRGIAYWSLLTNWSFRSNPDVPATISGVATTTSACPQNSTEVSGQSPPCTCNAGFKKTLAGTQCEAAEACPLLGQYSAVTQADRQFPTSSPTQCNAGCEYTAQSVRVGVDGKFWGTWPFRSTGTAPPASCAGPTAVAPTNETGTTFGVEAVPAQCPTGQCPGTINGAALCVPCFSESVPPVTTSASGTAGNSASTTTTTCTGSTCVTTTNTTDGAGNLTGTTSTTAPKESFCSQNPGLSICKEGAFGGACGAFTCGGDAVQCAMAKEQHSRNCTMFATATPLSDKGNASADGVLQPTGHPGATPSVVPVVLSGLISQVPLFGSTAGCPANVTVGQWVLPFSNMCPQLALIGVALKALALLVAAFITFRKGV